MPQKRERAREMKWDHINQLCDVVRETSFAIHKYHRNGHLEKIYENALVNRLRKQGLKVEQQFPLTVYDEDGTILGEYFADLFVEDSPDRGTQGGQGDHRRACCSIAGISEIVPDRNWFADQLRRGQTVRKEVPDDTGRIATKSTKRHEKELFIFVVSCVFCGLPDLTGK